MKAMRKTTWAFAVALALLWSACVTTTGQSRSVTPLTPSPSSVEPLHQPASAATYYVRPDGGPPPSAPAWPMLPTPAVGPANPEPGIIPSARFRQTAHRALPGAIP